MTTPLYPTFEKRIRDSFDQLIRKQATPWAFFNSGKLMTVTKHDGSVICYENKGFGGAFEGSPHTVFWSRYIEPFMEEISIKEIHAAVKMARKRNVDATLLLPEVEGLLFRGVRKTFSEMAKIDQRLRGRGFPEKIPLRPIEEEYQKMKSFIEVRVQSELDMWRPKSKRERWIERNKFVVWIVGIVISLFGVVMLLLRLFRSSAYPHD